MNRDAHDQAILKALKGIERNTKMIAESKQTMNITDYEKGVKDFAHFLIDKQVSDYSDIVDLAAEFLKEGD